MRARNFAMRETSLKMRKSTPLRSLAIMHAFTSTNRYVVFVKYACTHTHTPHVQGGVGVFQAERAAGVDWVPGELWGGPERGHSRLLCYWCLHIWHWAWQTAVGGPQEESHRTCESSDVIVVRWWRVVYVACASGMGSIDGVWTWSHECRHVKHKQNAIVQVACMIRSHGCYLEGDS